MSFRPPPHDRSIDERLAFGVINVDKPPGPSSHQVVTWVKEILGIERAAHAGTLDPKVTGCLPILLGDATRLARAILHGKKRYVAVLELHDRPPARFDDVVASFEGPIYQKPPRKSAVTRRLRTRTIYRLDALEVSEREALLDITCESGTYIRKLCHDLGLVLGVGGHMGDLRRIGTEPFDDRDLHTLHGLSDALAIAEAGESHELETMIQPGERALTHLPSVTIAPSAAESVANGAPVYAPGIIECDAVSADDTPLVACYTPDGVAICLGHLVGDPAAETGEVVSLERVLVDPGSRNASA